MALDPVTEAGILDWIGQIATGEDIEAAYIMAGTVDSAALSILRRRRANAGPGKWSLSGDYSEDDNGATVAWLDRQIKRLEAATGCPVSDLPTLEATPMCRFGPNR